jgi:histidyl-tRNA synthetase
MPLSVGPKGTRDFFPEDMALQQFIFSSWEKNSRRYGFEPYEGPAFEHLDLYTKKSGAEIEEQLYFFKDKKGRDLALRPEMTPTLARMVASRGNNLRLPLRWYSIPRLFRYEKMQKGRLREFFQLNMDIIGIAEESADAELIAAAIDMMRVLGFTAKDFKVRIASRTLLDELFILCGCAKEQCCKLYSLLDRKGKASPEDFHRSLSAVITERNVLCKIEKILDSQTLDDISRCGGTLPSLKTLQSLFETIDLYGFSEYAVFDIGIVRGLAYYTGIVFEIFDSTKSMRAVAGGGRYDNLIEHYGGPSLPAAGFAVGDVVLAELMKEKGINPSPTGRSFCFINVLEGTDPREVITVAQGLRTAGVSCEFSLKKSSLNKQMKIANAARSPYVLFIGGEESSQGMVKMKNMSTGEEMLVPRDEITNKMAGLFSHHQL